MNKKGKHVTFHSIVKIKYKQRRPWVTRIKDDASQPSDSRKLFNALISDQAENRSVVYNDKVMNDLLKKVKARKTGKTKRESEANKISTEKSGLFAEDIGGAPTLMHEKYILKHYYLKHLPVHI